MKRKGDNICCPKRGKIFGFMHSIKIYHCFNTNNVASYPSGDSTLDFESHNNVWIHTNPNTLYLYIDILWSPFDPCVGSHLRLIENSVNSSPEYCPSVIHFSVSFHWLWRLPGGVKDSWPPPPPPCSDTDCLVTTTQHHRPESEGGPRKLCEPTMVRILNQK